jgi:hypothetical protein
VVVVTAPEAAAEEAVVHTLPEVQAVGHIPAVVQVVVVRVQEVVVHLRPVADNHGNK